MPERAECSGKRRSRITVPGYRKGQKPPNWKKTYPPEPLTAAEVFKLMDACGPHKKGLRNRALIVLMWRTGLRVSEALDLRPHHVDFEAKRVKVLRGKGLKSRTVAIDTGALMEIQVWLMERAMLGVSADAPLFCTVNKPTAGNTVHPAYVRTLLRTLRKRAGISKRVHPHGLRHSLACDLMRERVPLSHIQSQLGHGSPATTGLYLRGLGADEAFEVIANREWPGGGS
jgi:integrase